MAKQSRHTESRFQTHWRYIYTTLSWMKIYNLQADMIFIMIFNLYHSVNQPNTDSFLVIHV